MKMKKRKEQVDNLELQRALLKSFTTPIQREENSIWNIILASIGFYFLIWFFVTHDYWNLGGAITFLVMSQLIE